MNIKELVKSYFNLIDIEEYNNLFKLNNDDKEIINSLKKSIEGYKEDCDEYEEALLDLNNKIEVLKNELYPTYAESDIFEKTFITYKKWKPKEKEIPLPLTLQNFSKDEEYKSKYLNWIGKKTYKDSNTLIYYVYKFVQKFVANRYKRDKKAFGYSEYYLSPQEVFDYYVKEGKYADCLKWDTKLMLSNGNLINIEDINVGDFIIGKNGKLKLVKNKWDKGIKETFIIKLNNGTEIISTEEHKFILNNNKEKLMKDLKIGDELKQNKYIYINSIDEKNKEYWYLKGLFIADGWIDTHKKKWIHISGQDGCKKEKQKEWVKSYCERQGYKYVWNRKYISIKSEELYNDFLNCGKGAINKNINTYPSSEENIKSLLEGLKSDSYTNKYGSVTFGTISDSLKNDIVQLYRMIGVSCYVSQFMPTKTQYGKNPIWRIYPRLHQEKKLKIIGIEKNCKEQVYDIEVEDNEIYLPENDCVVHNCEDVSALLYGAIVSLMIYNGFENELWKLKRVNLLVEGSGGHAILLWVNEKGRCVPLESTFNEEDFDNDWKYKDVFRGPYCVVGDVFDENGQYKYRYKS